MHPAPITRRQLLRYSATSLLAAGLWPGAMRAQGDSGSFRFAVLNDLHYLNTKCTPWFEKVVRLVNDQAVEFTLIAGDLVEHGTPVQHGAIRELLGGLKTPHYVVVGNHDYATHADRKSYEQLHPQRINYHFDHKGWQFVGLDTSEGQRSQNVKAPKETFDWLDAQLSKLDKQKPTVIFTHFPLGFGVPLLLQNAKPLLERFLPFNLQAAFSGHFHGFTETKKGATTLTTNKCCSFSRRNHDKSLEKGYFLCEGKDGKIVRSFVEVKL
jgi:predicted phosphodiesterase